MTKVFIDDVEYVPKASQPPSVNPPPVTPPPITPPTPPPVQPVGITKEFGVSTYDSIGAGVTKVYSFTLNETNKNSLKLNLYGRTPTTNAIYKWFFPDGTEFPKYFNDCGLNVPDTIVGSTSSGGFEVRAKNNLSPNSHFPFIPTGVHTLKITTITGSEIGIWASLR